LVTSTITTIPISIVIISTFKHKCCF
jgi:hypothetical protein